MIKAVYVAEDDSHLGLNAGDVVYVDTADNEPGYIYTNQYGERLFIDTWEIEEIKGE